MRIVFVRGMLEGYSSASYGAKKRVVELPLLVADDFDIETADRLNFTSIDDEGDLEYARLMTNFREALR